MDPLNSYADTTNFVSSSAYSRLDTPSRYSAVLPPPSTKQQLPSFSEVSLTVSPRDIKPFAELPQILHPDMPPYDSYHSHHMKYEQQDESRHFQSASGPRRSSLSSPDHAQTANSTPVFDNMSSRSVDSTYQDPRHHKQSSSWTSNSQFSDVVGSFNPQRPQYPKVSPSLPPLRDHLTNTTGYEQNYQSPVSAYPQSYGTTGVGQNSMDLSPYASERQPYYDTQRFGHHYSQANRPQAAQVDYYRYNQPGITYQASHYAPVDYATSPIALQHSSSPSVCADTDSRNRRRRGNLPKPITDLLRAWFHEHLDHPYPTEEDKQAFAAQTGLSLNQVRTKGQLDTLQIF